MPEAKKLPEITYNEMLELASLGAQVLNNRSVELAKSYGVQLEVLSSFSGNPGTIVKEVVKNVEKTYIAGVAQDKKIARIALAAMPDVPGVAYKVFSMLAKEKINVDMILQSYGHDECKDIVFTVANKDAARCEEVLNANRDSLKFDHIDINTDVAKVSVVGAGMQGNPGVAAKMFEALYAAHINIHMISTSEIKLSVLIDKEDSEARHARGPCAVLPVIMRSASRIACGLRLAFAFGVFPAYFSLPPILYWWEGFYEGSLVSCLFADGACRKRAAFCV